MGIFDRFKQKNNIFENQIIELMQDNFNVMYLPLFQLFDNNDTYYLKYQYPNYAQNKTLYKENIKYIHFDTCLYLEFINNGKVVVAEIQDKGTLVFTNHSVSDIFSILQHHYPDVRSFVFEANNTGGYFKILENGRITRKIASNLIMDNITNTPETRGKPCEYEIQNNIQYKIDMKAKYARDMLPNFNKKEVLDLFDYYVGKDCLDNNKIKNVTVYDIK